MTWNRTCIGRSQSSSTIANTLALFSSPKHHFYSFFADPYPEIRNGQDRWKFDFVAPSLILNLSIFSMEMAIHRSEAIAKVISLKKAVFYYLEKSMKNGKTNCLRFPVTFALLLLWEPAACSLEHYQKAIE